MQFVGQFIVRSGRERSGYEYALPAFTFALIFGLIRFYAAK